jgi:hypothetical protein
MGHQPAKPTGPGRGVPKKEQQPNNGFELTRSAMARRRGPRSSTQCWADLTR